MEEKIQSCLVYYTYESKKWIIRFFKYSQVGTKWLCKLARNSVYSDSFFCLIMCSVQFSSVTQSCLTPCNPMDSSTPGLPVHHQLPEFTQTHVHWVGDAIQPSHPLSSPSPSALNLSQHQGLFKWVNSLHEVAKAFEFQLHYQSFQWTPGLISFRMDWLDLLAVQGTCKSLLQYHCSKSINSLGLSFLYSPTLTSIHDYWKNHVLRKSKLSWKQTFCFHLYLNSKTSVHTLCLWCALQPVKDLSRIVSSSVKPSRALFDLMSPSFPSVTAFVAPSCGLFTHMLISKAATEPVHISIPRTQQGSDIWQASSK